MISCAKNSSYNYMKKIYYNNNILIQKCRQVWYICFYLMFCQHIKTQNILIMSKSFRRVVCCFYSIILEFIIFHGFLHRIYSFYYICARVFGFWTKSAALDNNFIFIFFKHNIFHIRFFICFLFFKELRFYFYIFLFV